MSEYHVPVLLKESVDALVTDPSGFYIDATYGGGGHSAEILSRLSPEGRLMAFDRDSDAMAGRVDDPRLTLIHNNFRFVHNFALLEARKAARDYRECVVDGILADLGVSSHQFDTADRGFSFRYDAPLDMRMNTMAELTAADVLNTYAQEEVDNARRLAALVAAVRAKAEIRTTGDLDAAIRPALPAFAEHKYLAKVYQALRIEVNQEMRALGKFLDGAAKSLKPGGRLVVITYHSLEDRMVKNFIKSGNVGGTVEKDMYGRTCTPLRALDRKPVLPQESEIAANTRARSAKLRTAEKAM